MKDITTSQREELIAKAFQILKLKPIDIVECDFDPRDMAVSKFVPKADAIKVGAPDILIAYNARRDDDMNIDKLVNVAHEIRHYFQYSKDMTSFAKYIRSGEKYFVQKLEVDAIAFSELFVQTYVRSSIKLALPPELRLLVDVQKTVIETELKTSSLRG